jgi:hypothetical protein
VRAPTTFFLLFCLLLVSCSRHHLPPIEDAVALHKDCSLLYRQFPVGEIPTNAPDFDYEHSLSIRTIAKDKWPDSILTLHPYMVCSYQGGIQIWIALSQHRQIVEAGAYYVAFDPELPPPPHVSSNYFVFSNTPFRGIYEVRQKFEAAKTNSVN